VKQFLFVVVAAVAIVGCGKKGSNLGSDGKCTVEGFRPFGKNFPALTSDQRALVLKTALTKAESYYSFIFLLSNPDKPTVLPGHPFMAEVKSGFEAGKCKATDDPWFPKKGVTKTEISMRGESCPVEAYLIMDDRKGAFEGESSATYRRMSKFNDLSLAKTDLLGMKFDGKHWGDNIPEKDAAHTSICEELTGTLETKSLGNIAFYASEESRHVIPSDDDPMETFKGMKSHRKIRRGFQFTDFVAELELVLDSKAEKKEISVTLNGEALTKEELALIGGSNEEVLKTISAN